MKKLKIVALALVLAIVIGTAYAATTAKKDEEADPDARIDFVSWTINGKQVPPGRYTVSNSTIIDTLYRQRVKARGQPGFYQIKEWSFLKIHYIGPRDSAWLHVVNHPGAVFKVPWAFKKSQFTTVDNQPVERSTLIQLNRSQPKVLDVHTEWKLKKNVNYRKVINWLHIGEATDENVLFDTRPPASGVYELNSCAEVMLEEGIDSNPGNNRACSPVPMEIEVAE